MFRHDRCQPHAAAGARLGGLSEPAVLQVQVSNLTTTIGLTSSQCKPCSTGMSTLTEGQTSSLLQQLDGWKQQGHLISKDFQFKNYYQTIAFVNAVAWLSHREDHHPDLTVGYNTCQVAYTTHAVNGLSENDFICAAKVDALLKI